MSANAGTVSVNVTVQGIEQLKSRQAGFGPASDNFVNGTNSNLHLTLPL